MARPLSEDELLRLIDALAPGEWQSGEALAAEAGVTRAALAKRVTHLREWGLQVEAEAGRGYRLAQPLQRLDAANIRTLLPAQTSAKLRHVEVLTRTDSTNQRLLEADSAQDPQALFAELQTAGRGRRGREWRSPFGANLYLSLAWSFPTWPPQLSALSLAVGVACARALRKAGLDQVMLKWPNDLRIGNDKLGGILIEQRGEAGGACRVVIGIGINVSMSPEQAGALGQPWTSVQAALASTSNSKNPPFASSESRSDSYREASAAPERNALAAGLLAELITAITEFETAGFTPFLHDWSTLDATANQQVRIEGGGEPLQGIGRGVDAQGALIVEAQGRRHHVHAGEVSLRFGPAP
ncbi:bifunctional biotin--[acetyl-CoA-carboxylase] synthetase/biotin operon repressor [Nevskia soli]|uniref:bifunctional biotin--[acetyl-CoA-carboxylase] synthetase/biotin operon repressor n=1 Tax=Nevskia soli TaxID=418856 RepID=UPI0004A6EAF1|nr:bifunctional biotin--[acetyl-CoA-carboxylase] synthetase/biotin operon repressor [Nevskia soli]